MHLIRIIQVDIFNWLYIFPFVTCSLLLFILRLEAGGLGKDKGMIYLPIWNMNLRPPRGYSI